MVLEADGYQPYLLSPEKGLRALVKKALELAKDPAKSCVDEVSCLLDLIYLTLFVSSVEFLLIRTYIPRCIISVPGLSN